VTATKTKKKKRALRARVGDLAIAKFDDCDVVALVTGCSGDTSCGRDYQVMYWRRVGDRTVIERTWFPVHRLTRARPQLYWDGMLSELTIDLVDPILEGEE